MRIAISNIAWEPREERSVRALMTRYGATGVEIAPTKLWNTPTELATDQITAVRDSWGRDGVTIVALQSLLFRHPELTVFDSAETRSKTQAYLFKLIELAGRLGAGALVFGSPKNRLQGGRPVAEVERIATEFFSAMAEEAFRCGTCFCLEPNPPEYGCDYVCTVQEALAVIRRINHPGLKLNLDTGILTMNQESVDQTIEDAFPWIGHVHLSEPHLATVGTGPVDHQRVGQVLRKLGYSGWVSIEMRAGEEPNSDRVETALRTAATFYGW